MNNKQLKDIVNDESEVRKIADNSFQQYDAQQKGFIVKEDVEKLLNDFATNRQLDPPDQDIIDEFFQEYANKDGKMSKEIFNQLISQGLLSLNEFQN